MDVFNKYLVELYALLNKGTSINTALEYTFKAFGKYIPYDRIAIALLDNDGNIYAEFAKMEYEPRLKTGYYKNISDSSLINVINSNEPRIINNYIKYLKQKPNSEPTGLMLDEGIKSSLTCPLNISGNCIGVMFFCCKSSDSYEESHTAIAKTIASTFAAAIEKNQLVDELILTSIIGFARLVEAKDTDTGAHLERMQNYSRLTASSKILLCSSFIRSFCSSVSSQVNPDGRFPQTNKTFFISLSAFCSLVFQPFKNWTTTIL